MRIQAFLLVVSATCVIGCGGEPGPVAPTPLGTAPPDAPAPAIVAIDTVSGIAIPSPTVTRSGSRVTVEAAGYVTRETNTAASVDLIPTALPFDLTFYRALVRNAHDAPTELQPLRRQQKAPRFYVRTIDETGANVPAALIDLAVAVMGTADQYTGGRFATAAVERGTDTREEQSGSVTVKWLAAFPENMCGRAAVGGRWIELYYLNPRCRCAGTAVSVRTMRHELGHAMGFWHSGAADDVMTNPPGARCDLPLSARERHHMALAYQRPIGNRDPDVDPFGASSFMTRATVVVD